MGVTDGQPMSSPLDYEFCARTDVGRVRSNNEDALTVCADVRLIVVADGMGGYNAGEVASAMAVQVIEQELGAWLMAAGMANHFPHACPMRQIIAMPPFTCSVAPVT